MKKIFKKHNGINDESNDDEQYEMREFNVFSEIVFDEEEYKRKLEIEKQKIAVKNERKKNHELWIEKMEKDKKINEKDKIIMTKILLNEAYIKNNKNDKEFFLCLRDNFYVPDSMLNSDQIKSHINSLYLFNPNENI